MVSEERSTRSKRPGASRKQPSASHYVGYVDDEESVASILKKFEELEKFQTQIQSTKDVKGEE